MYFNTYVYIYIYIYIRISLFTLQYNYDKTTWKLIKIRKWYSKLWCSENIAYMYVHNKNFWGRKLLKFCGYSRKCSMQSLVRTSFVGSSKQLIKFYYTKIFFPPIHESFLLQNFLLYNMFLAPTDTNIYQTLCLENCWLLFTFCSVCKPISLHNYEWLWIMWLYIGKCIAKPSIELTNNLPHEYWPSSPTCRCSVGVKDNLDKNYDRN